MLNCIWVLCSWKVVTNPEIPKPCVFQEKASHKGPSDSHIFRNKTLLPPSSRLSYTCVWFFCLVASIKPQTPPFLWGALHLFPHHSRLNTVTPLIVLCTCLSHSTAFYSRVHPFYNNLLIISGGWKTFHTQWRSRLFLITDTPTPRHKTNTWELIVSALQSQPQVTSKNTQKLAHSFPAGANLFTYLRWQTDKSMKITNWILHHLLPSGEQVNTIDQPRTPKGQTIKPNYQLLLPPTNAESFSGCTGTRDKKENTESEERRKKSKSKKESQVLKFHYHLEFTLGAKKSHAWG